MKTMLKYYYYLYYKIYHSIKYTSQQLGGEFWTDIKALLVLNTIMICNVLSLFGYYNIFIDKFFKLDKYIFITMCLLIMIINYMLLLYSTNGTKYYNSFDNLSKKDNIKGTFVVIGFIILTTLNFFYMLYLKSQIDWSIYR